MSSLMGLVVLAGCISRTADEYCQLAWVLLREGHFDDAAADARRAIRQDRSTPKRTSFYAALLKWHNSVLKFDVHMRRFIEGLSRPEQGANVLDGGIVSLSIVATGFFGLSGDCDWHRGVTSQPHWLEHRNLPIGLFRHPPRSFPARRGIDSARRLAWIYPEEMLPH